MGSGSYKFHDADGLYFVTFATVQWVDAFTRSEYAEIVLESLRFCQKEKGLVRQSSLTYRFMRGVL